MCQTQKWAWFNLVVVALTLITIGVSYPFLGKGALGGLGILGLMGFGALFHLRKRGRVITDERDKLIQERSMNVAFRVFWLAFVAAAVLALFYYKDGGMVPILVVEIAVWFGWILFVSVQSITILVLYGKGG